MKISLPMTVILVVFGVSQLSASTIDTLPVFLARKTDQTIGTASGVAQDFIPTPGTTAINSFSFYLQYDPSATTLSFSLYAWDGKFPLGTSLLTVATTSSPLVEPPKPGVITDFRTVTANIGSFPVTPGNRYLAAMFASGPPNVSPISTVATALPAGSVYPGGDLYIFTPQPFGPQFNDAAFTATFTGGIDQIYTTAPEPSTVTLFMIGTLGLLLASQTRAGTGR